MVYVLSKNGKPLMPTTNNRKVRLLLKANQAKVVTRTPFTIQLLHTTHCYVQPITLGIDAGSKTIGVSATTEKAELFSAEVVLRNDISKNLTAKATFRRGRRNRKTRYRKARFLNRVKSKNKGWLAPSVEHKINSHIKVVGNVHGVLPISKIIVETASFDIHKLMNPDVKGKGYQKGPQYEFSNLRDAVLYRDSYSCQHCKKKKNTRLEVHHIIFRKDGGADTFDNLITLCEDCHAALHRGEFELKAKAKKFSHPTFMGIMRKTLLLRLRNIYPLVLETYGYITKEDRIFHKLDKSHRIDAYCIAKNFDALPLNCWYAQKFVRSKNRQLHKATINKGGIRKLNQSPRYVFGFQLFDKIEYQGQEAFIFGRRASGNFDVRKLDGTKLSAGVSYKKLTLLEKRRSLLYERQDSGISSHP